MFKQVNKNNTFSMKNMFYISGLVNLDTFVMIKYPDCVTGDSYKIKF